MLSVLGGVLARKSQLTHLDLKSIRKIDRREIEQTLTAGKHHKVRELPPPEALDLLVTRSSPPPLGRTPFIVKAREQEFQKDQPKQ